MKFRNTAGSFDYIFDPALSFDDEEVTMLAMDLVHLTLETLDKHSESWLFRTKAKLTPEEEIRKEKVLKEITESVYKEYEPYLDVLKDNLKAAGELNIMELIKPVVEDWSEQTVRLSEQSNGLGAWNFGKTVKKSMKRFWRRYIRRRKKEDVLEQEIGELQEDIEKERRIRDTLQKADIGKRKEERIHHWNGRLAWKEQKLEEVRIELENERKKKAKVTAVKALKKRKVKVKGKKKKT